MTLNLSNLVCDIKETYKWDDKPIGIGGNGMVYKGERIKDHFAVAVKILDKSRITHYLEEKKHFIREVNYLYGINHPFCLKLINVSFNPFAIITPFMEDGSLTGFLNPKSEKYNTFSPTQKMCTVYSICSTMDAIHSTGLIHRDLKPDNIFMQLNGDYYDAYIADFGSARIADQNIHLTECPNGTPHHQAPESYFGNDYTNSVDVFSFGIIYLQYFRYEFEYDDDRKVVQKAFPIIRAIRDGAKYKKPENMSIEQYKVYLQCTSLNDSQRPAFRELAEMFELCESLWFKDVDKDKYLAYVKKCKNDCLEYKKSYQKTPDLESTSFNMSSPLIGRKSSRSSLSSSSSRSLFSSAPSSKPSHKDYA